MISKKNVKNKVVHTKPKSILLYTLKILPTVAFTRKISRLPRDIYIAHILLSVLIPIGIFAPIALIQTIVAGETIASRSQSFNAPTGIVLIAIILWGYIDFRFTLSRLHDTEHSFFYLFIRLIPIVGTIKLILTLFSEGDPYDNYYGDEFKYEDY